MRPFRGIRYNPGVVKDLGRVMCPPYDVMTSEEQEFYHRRSAHNVIRLERGVGGPGENVCLRAAETFKGWVQEGVLKRDEEPAFYLQSHSFLLGDKRLTRRALYARLKLEEGAALPHEDTSPQPKIERLELLRACKADISPVMALYDDVEGRVSGLLVRATSHPLAEFDDEQGGHHVFSMIADRVITDELTRLFHGRRLYIADGHHRYETAVTYQRERRASEPAAAEADYDFVLVGLTSFSDPGLVVLPVHRMVKALTADGLTRFDAELGQFLTPEVPDGIRVLLAGAKGALGVRLPLGLVRQAAGKTAHCEAYWDSPTAIVEHLLLSPVGSREVAYSADAGHVRQSLINGEFHLGFLLPPVSLAIIKAMADAGDRLPRKSTFFYPKLPTGLVIYPVDEI
ncbi:MAG: DUF1015 domain-containing protein [Chloroflexota bacterium]